MLCLYSGLVNADWSGVAVELSDSESDWKFDAGLRQSHSTELSFRIEEKTDLGLRIGANFGYINLRVDSNTSADSNSFDAQFLSINLRQPFQISEAFALLAGMNFRLLSGSDNDESNEADIEWSEIRYQLGASFKIAHIKISPLLEYQIVDGDIRGNNGTENFKQDDSVSVGIRFDYFVEPTAFVRLEFQSGGREGLFLSFAREY